ncbi:MAG: 50S ribosomal protein L3 [Thermoplasmata archaeon M9B1D]|nr:MAG: 50S ribosomal protein L3 [Thermoplasmata archaeon M8B2D]PNX49057.1 MAG: 50S ribosomal protein L3 [Thermoplasmata archaeon M9B1D]
MPKNHHPRRGSMGFSPRKRAKAETPHIKSWPEGLAKPKIQGFLGYKAGMTHAHIVDYRPTSTTSGKEVLMPVSVVETPPIKVAAVRAYKKTSHGLQTAGEIWADKLDPELTKKISIAKKEKKKNWDFTKDTDELRVIIYTQPKLVTGIPKKTPEIREFRIAGGIIDDQIKYAKEILGKEVKIKDTLREGDMIDTIAITKGKGFQGRVKRWGVKLLTHKNSKHRRMIGTQGSWHPNWVQATVPNAGQMGYHQRTEYNKRILKIGENGEEITPSGGFPNYGVIRNSYILLHGSIPGPTKRLISMRDAIRYQRGVKVEKPEITYISTTSKQGA